MDKDMSYIHVLDFLECTERMLRLVIRIHLPYASGKHQFPFRCVKSWTPIQLSFRTYCVGIFSPGCC